MVVCKKFFKILVVICLILITFLAFSFIFNRYKIKPTEKEIVELKKFYKSIIHISSIKDILVLQNFTIDKIKHESIGIDEIDISKILKVKKEKTNIIPGILHIDNTSRMQTLKYEDNHNYYNLLKEFYNLTNVYSI
jgi:hypothetical protein